MYGYRMAVEAPQQRIIMRPYVREEAELMVRGMSAYPVTRMLAPLGAQTLETEQAWLEQLATNPNEVAWAICVAQDAHDNTGTPIGNSTLRLEDGQAVSGSVIYNRAFWGRGIVGACHRARIYYACQVLDLLRITSSVLDGNTASLRALERVGYVQTGVQYCALPVEGVMRDMLELLWVNPQPAAWDYHWRGRPAPAPFVAARERAVAALQWAEQKVEFLY